MNEKDRYRIYYPHQTPSSTTNDYFLQSMTNQNNNNQTRVNNQSTTTNDNNQTTRYTTTNYNPTTVNNYTTQRHNNYPYMINTQTKSLSQSSNTPSNNIKTTYYVRYQQPKQKKQKQLISINKMTLRQGVKQLHFCQKQQIVVLLTSDSILVANSVFGQITCTIKKMAYPRHVALARNGKFMVAYFSDNTATIMDLNGRQISNVIGIPRSSSIFVISKNCHKLMYGSNQQICLWNIEKAQIQVMTRQWKNINCFALSQDGNQFALGTYGGSIFVLTIIGEQKVSQFQIKKHTSCVMCMSFHKNNLASVAYDGSYIETIIQTNQRNQKVLTYNHHQLTDVPRSLTSCGDNIYFVYLTGLFWLQGAKLKGFKEGTWNVVELKQNNKQKVVFVKYDRAEIQWWEWD